MHQPAPDSRALEAAFAAFNEHSGSREASYRSLQGRVEELTERLEVAQSERHRELLEKERLGDRLGRLLETLPGAFLVIDGDGVVLECNDRATDLLQRPLLGCCWSDIAHREFRPCDRVDGDLQLKDGRWVNLFRRPLEVDDGETLLLTDVTDTRQTSRLIDRQERLTSLGEMSASLAHQIRTPLASAMLYLSDYALTERTNGHEGNERSSAAKALDCLRALDCLVSDTLAFASGTKHDQARVPVLPLLQSVVNTLVPQVADSSRVRLAFTDASLEIDGDRNALHGALLNLVSNALETSPDTTVELYAACNRDDVWLMVADDGPGIAQDVHARLFDPFFTTRKRGTGLGLSIVRSVARAHGGDVIVDSSSAGATFALCLPNQREDKILPGGHSMAPCARGESRTENARA